MGGAFLVLAIGIVLYFRQKPAPPALTAWLIATVDRAGEREAARVTVLEERVAAADAQIRHMLRQLIYYDAAIQAVHDKDIVAAILAKIPEELYMTAEPLVQEGKLSDDAQIQLAALLTNAFPDLAALKRLVLGTLGSAGVQSINWDRPRSDVTDALVEYAESRSLTPRVIQAAQLANPDNITLRAWARKYKKSTMMES